MKSIRLGFVSRDLSRFPVLKARVFFWVVLSLSRVTMDDPNKPRCLGETLRPAALFWPWTIGNHLTIRGWTSRPLVLWAKIRIIVGVCCESHWWRWHICQGVWLPPPRLCDSRRLSVRLLAKYLKVINRFHWNFQEIMEQAIDDYILVTFGIPEALWPFIFQGSRLRSWRGLWSLLPIYQWYWYSGIE